jgi:glycine cleavage system H protein
MNVPDDLLYTVEHEWVRRLSETRFRIGITDYAQDQLGDVVFVELPEVGKTVGRGDLMAEIESTKSVGEVYAPLAGTIASTNTAAADDPALVNSSPYEEGWLVEIEGETSASLDGMLDATAYRDLTE